MTTSPSDGSTYFIDAESGAEMARLLQQDRLFTQGMGGILPESSNDFSGISRVLDVGCGPGGWALEVAQTSPMIEVVGIDISGTMIEYAQAQAQVQGLQNVHFRVMDALKPLDFADNTFDLVNLRFLVGFVPTAMWSPLLTELRRVTRVGGRTRLTDTECGISNSAALECMMRMLSRALKSAGHSFSPDERLFGTTAMMGYFLRIVGYQNIGLKAHMIEYTTGMEAHDAFYQDWKVGFQLALPFFLKTGATTQEEFDSVYPQMLIEMMADDFCAVYDLLTVWGTKG